MADIQDRIHGYLSLRPSGVSCAEIAREILRLRGGTQKMMDRIVDAALRGDPRFQKIPDGGWRLSPPRGPSPAETPVFTAVSLTVTGRHGAFTPNRVWRIGAVRVAEGKVADRLFRVIARTPGAAEDGGADDGEGVPLPEALDNLRAFSQDTTLAAEDLRSTLSLLSWEAHRAGVSALGGEGLSLMRLGRRLFPDLRLRSLGDLAQALGMTRHENGRADREADALGAILIAALERCRSRGASSVPAILSLQEPDLEDIDYSRYQFDRTFLRNLPERPGAYLMYDRKEILLYVGKAKSLRDRVASYFVRTAVRSAKMEEFLRRLSRIRIHVVGSELEALLLEGRLIRRHRPEFNTQLEVHERVQAPPLRDAIYVLPSGVEGCVELFMLRDGCGLRQVRAFQDLTDLDEVKSALEEFYGDQSLPEEVMEQERTDAEIARTWLAAHGEGVSRLELKGSQDLAEALRLVERYISGCAPTWERVTYL